ncbi:unnamed protein product [marine sediment metagenome]|uniref:Uncharacterized protein n=1 Tax=marine sediment metagenome TaxID=412755 RepID=X1MJK3_9ZZZZ
MSELRVEPEQQPLWDDFLEKYGTAYHDYQYDVQLAPLRDTLSVAQGRYRQKWEALTCPRVDAIATDLYQTTFVFEVRPSADSGALLRLLGYGYLLQRLEKLPKMHNLAIVCREIKPVTQALCETCNVRVYTVPPGVRGRDLTSPG